MLYRALVEPGYLNSGTYNNVVHDFKVKHPVVKKAVGLGVSEFMLRFVAWLCLRNNDYRNSQMKVIGSERPRKVPKDSLNIWSASTNSLSCSCRMKIFIPLVYCLK
jgi:hypothetical protein